MNRYYRGVYSRMMLITCCIVGLFIFGIEYNYIMEQFANPANKLMTEKFLKYVMEGCVNNVCM